MSIQSIRVALNAAIRAAAQRIGGKRFSRKSALTAETVIRLFIGAEGGSFDDLVIQPEPKKDEIGALVEMLKRSTFAQKTLIIADRGFERSSCERPARTVKSCWRTSRGTPSPSARTGRTSGT